MFLVFYVQQHEGHFTAQLRGIWINQAVAVALVYNLALPLFSTHASMLRLSPHPFITDTTLSLCSAFPFHSSPPTTIFFSFYSLKQRSKAFFLFYFLTPRSQLESVMRSGVASCPRTLSSKCKSQCCVRRPNSCEMQSGAAAPPWSLHRLCSTSAGKRVCVHTRVDQWYIHEIYMIFLFFYIKFKCCHRIGITLFCRSHPLTTGS